MTDAERRYWTELRRAALAEAAAIERYTEGQIDAAMLHIELRRAALIWQRATQTYEATTDRCAAAQDAS